MTDKGKYEAVCEAIFQLKKALIRVSGGVEPQLFSIEIGQEARHYMIKLMDHTTFVSYKRHHVVEEFLGVEVKVGRP